MLPDPASAIPAEKFDKLKLYQALLAKWQASINLVGPSTIPGAWDRHFLDSAQLSFHIPQGAHKVFDLGSGAGFPGLVLAILRPDLEMHLIESDERKCAFLRTVSRETGAGAIVHNCRIEVCEESAPDLVTARALAPLAELLGYASRWLPARPGLFALFLKGGAAEQEVAEAGVTYEFSVERIASLTDPTAAVLKISGIKLRQD